MRKAGEIRRTVERVMLTPPESPPLSFSVFLGIHTSGNLRGSLSFLEALFLFDLLSDLFLG